MSSVKPQAANSSAAPASTDQVHLVVIRSLVPQVPQRDLESAADAADAQELQITQMVVPNVSD